MKNPETLHPSQIIDTSEKVIVHAFNIQIFNSKFEQISDDTINHSITEYEGYIQIRNEARRERGGFEEIYKHQKQIWHDVLLREAIEWLRKREVEGEVQTFSEIKYLGVTLDKLLIAFDKFELGKRRRVIPNFYTPSFLLDRIRKFAPIQTDNYKRAFITAISSFNFYDKSVKKSKDAQKFVNYYRSKGLNDEKLLLSFLTDDLFLDSFFREETNEDEFFEAEISKKFTALQLEKEESEKKIKILKQRTDIKSNEVKIAESQIEKKDSEISELNDVLKQLKELANTNKKEAFENKNEKELYQKQVFDLTNRLNQIENENKFKNDLKNTKMTK